MVLRRPFIGTKVLSETRMLMVIAAVFLGLACLGLIAYVFYVTPPRKTVWIE